MEGVIILNKKINNKTFESIKHIDENGIEFWYARELMKVLEYSKWENFRKVIDKAMIACENSGFSIKDCFPDVRKSIISGKGKEDFIEDYRLNRYACYLIAQNGDTRKRLFLLHKHILRCKQEKWRLMKKNMDYLVKMKKDFIKEI